MAADGLLGKVRVGFSIGSPMSWTEITQLIDVEGPGMEADDVNNDVHNTSTFPNFHRSMPGMVAVAPMAVTVVSDFDEDTNVEQNTLWGLHQQGTTVWWRKEISVDRTASEYTPFEFQGYVASIEPGTPKDDRQTTVITVRFDGTALGRGVAAASAF